MNYVTTTLESLGCKEKRLRHINWLRILLCNLEKEEFGRLTSIEIKRETIPINIDEFSSIGQKLVKEQVILNILYE